MFMFVFFVTIITMILLMMTIIAKNIMTVNASIIHIYIAIIMILIRIAIRRTLSATATTTPRKIIKREKRKAILRIRIIMVKKIPVNTIIIMA